jgi:hypothetical protein
MVPLGAPSFRDLLKTYLIERPWVLLGTDLILGMPADKHLSPNEQSFLPFYLSFYLDSAKNPNHKKLVSSESYLLNNKPIKEPLPILSPGGVFWLILLFSLFGLSNKILARVFTILFYTLCGLLGLIILYLWLGTERTSFGLNLNILWASPILLVLLFLKDRPKTLISLFCLFQIFLLYIVMIFHIQGINPAVIPISLTLLVYLSRPFYPVLRSFFTEQIPGSGL